MSGVNFKQPISAVSLWPTPDLQGHGTKMVYSIQGFDVSSADTIDFSSPTASLATSQPIISNLVREVQELRRRLDALEQERVVVIRSVEHEDLKRELLAYFQRNPGSYPSDAAFALNLDTVEVRDAAGELVDEGLLG